MERDEPSGPLEDTASPFVMVTSAGQLIREGDSTFPPAQLASMASHEPASYVASESVFGFELTGVTIVATDEELHAPFSVESKAVQLVALVGPREKRQAALQPLAYYRP